MRAASVVILLLGFGVAYALLAPTAVNGDGVGYLKQVRGDELSPGHLAWLPLLRWLAGQTDWNVLLDLVPLYRGLGIGCALLTLLLTFDAGRRVHGFRSGLFAMAILGTCYGFSRSAMEVEVYAVSGLFSTATLWALVCYSGSRERERIAWALLAGVFAGFAFHFHLTLALLGPPLLLLLWRWGPPGRRGRMAALGAVAMAVTILVPLILVLREAGHTDLPGALAWLKSSDHGIPYPRPLLGPPIAVWGVIRSLCFSPYAYQAPVLIVVLTSALGAALWLALLRVRRRATSGRGARLLDGRFVLIWSVPLALFAVLFYPSDTERWIFLLPAVFLWLAPAATRSGRLVAFGAPAVLALSSFVHGHLPPALDTAPCERAAATEAVATGRDLVVSPGHGWEELVGLGTASPPRTFPLIFHVGALRDVDCAVALMHTEIRRTVAGGGRVYVARLRDSPDPQGFKELRWFGMTPEEFEALFAPFSPEPTDVPELWVLTPPLR